jgi:ABC-type Fe3+-hydroxamate transport system substrate-binding protein
VKRKLARLKVFGCASLFLLGLTTGSSAVAQRLVSLNPCFDEWAPQWLPETWEFIPSTAHGNRLERVLRTNPDIVLYGTYTNPRLVSQLTAATRTVLVKEPNTWVQWQETLTHVGGELQLEQSLQSWKRQQQRQLAQLPKLTESVLVIMPNQYSWGGGSFIVNMLRANDIPVLVADESQQLVQISLEQLIQLKPLRVVLDGFSSDYARANEWLWHSALKPWLTARRVVQIKPTVSGCPAQRAVEYMQQVVMP